MGPRDASTGHTQTLCNAWWAHVTLGHTHVALLCICCAFFVHFLCTFWCISTCTCSTFTQNITLTNLTSSITVTNMEHVTNMKHVTNMVGNMTRRQWLHVAKDMRARGAEGSPGEGRRAGRPRVTWAHQALHNVWECPVDASEGPTGHQNLPK